MAEQEVAKHTKAVYKVWNNPHTSWMHKLKETIIEILIIVFAVSLSIWLHNWSDKNHERDEELEFLQGLKTDLQHDVTEMSNDRNTFMKLINGANYFLKVSYGDTLSNDSLNKYKFIFYNTTQLNPNTSRFEGLKASGKIDIIEDHERRDHMLDLYQEDVPFLLMLTQNFNSYKASNLGSFLDKNLVQQKDGSANWETILHANEIRNALLRASTAQEIIDQYTKTIEESNKIIQEIDKDIQ